MKTLIKILLIVFMLYLFPPVNFAQDRVNGWEPNLSSYLSWIEKMGSTINGTSQDFYFAGGTISLGNWRGGQGNFSKSYPVDEETSDLITVDAQVTLKNASVTKLEVSIILEDSQGKYCGISNQLQLIPLNGNWTTLRWIMTPEIKAFIKNFRKLSISFKATTIDSCHITIKIPLKNLKLITGNTEKIIDFNFGNVGTENWISIPSGYVLSQNYPNPFNPATKISFTIPESGNYKLTVFNTLSQEVATLIDGQLSAGNHEASFNAANLPSGVYVYRLTGKNIYLSRKMTLLK